MSSDADTNDMTDPARTDRRLAALERRAAAPHPGPLIARDYLRPREIDAGTLADLVGMDGGLLEAMLAGTSPFDVDAAVRLGRGLGLAPWRIMRAQLRHDFALARANEGGEPVPPIDYFADRPFPATALRGHLARTEAAETHERLFFVADDDASGMESVHPLRVGDRLRVWSDDDRVAWAGPFLRNPEGSPLFVFAPKPVWETWFAWGARAEYVPAPPNA